MPTPIFTYGGIYDGVIDGIFIDSLGNISAGSFSGSNSFAPNEQVSEGTSTLYAKISVNNGCTFVVPFTYSNGSLPVNLVSFSGESTSEHQNVLKWITDWEKDFRHFEVQRSADARSFETIAIVDAKKTGVATGTLVSYKFTDLHARGAMYYRLKMVDQDETFTFSRIISIGNEREMTVVGKFYPNPTAGKVFVDVYSLSDEKWAFTVMSINGTVIQYKTENLRKGVNTVTLEGFVPGLNFIQFTNGSATEVRKVIRK